MEKYEVNLHDVSRIEVVTNTGETGWGWLTLTMFDADNRSTGEVNVWGPIMDGKAVAPLLDFKKSE